MLHLCNALTDALAELNSSAQLFLVMQHQQQDNRKLDLISRQSSMYRLVRVFAYVKLFTQRLQSRIKRRSSNNHSQSLPAIDHSNRRQKPKLKAVSYKKPQGNLQLKSFDNDQDHQHLQHTMKHRDESLNNFTEKLFVTNQQENRCEESCSSRTHLICRVSAIEKIPNNHSPFFRAAIKTNPYSQTFITAVKKQKICAHSPLSLSSTQSQRKSNLRNV